MSDPRRHHYVPQFLLRQWVGADGRLERFDKPRPDKIMVRRVFPTEVGFVRDLYTSPVEPDGRVNWLELDFLQRVDDLAARALVKMLRTPPEPLSADLQSAWSVFVRTLFHRSPEDLLSTQFQGMRIWEKTVRGIGDRYAEMKSPTDPATLEEYIARHSHDEVYRTVLNKFPSTMTGEKIGQFLNNLHRTIVETIEGYPTFLISDAVPARTNGLANPKGHYAIPLSPRRLLIAAHEMSTIREIKSMKPKDLVTSVNRWMVEGARRFVAATDRSQERFIRNRFGLQPIRPLSGPISQ